VFRLTEVSTIFTSLDRATEAFNAAKATLIDDMETVELVNTAPGRWMVIFYDIEDGAMIGAL
jgi:hypothetical protein